jgi:aryl-alcohol dehydrogenase-like predicted oxidoreductase
LGARAGTSEWTTAQITEAWGVADRLGLIGPAMEQPEYNLLNRKKARRRCSQRRGWADRDPAS